MKTILKIMVFLYAATYPFLLLLPIPRGTTGALGFLLITICIILWSRTGGIFSSIYASIITVCNHFLMDTSLSAIISGIIVYLLLGFAGGWFTYTIRMQNKALAKEIGMRKAMGEKLLENEKFLSNALRIAKLGPWTLNLDTNTVWLSDEHVEMLGFHKGEIAQQMPPEQYIARFVHPDDIPLIMDVFQDILLNDGPGGDIGEAEYQMLRKDGFSLDVHLIYHRDRADRSFLYGTVQDVTDMRRIEKDLRSTLQQLQVLKDALDESFLVTITDERGKIIHANERFCELSGYPRERLLGKDHRIMKSGHHPSEFFAEMWQTILKGKVWRNEILNRNSTGVMHWLDTTIVPMKDTDGRRQYVAIRKDVTVRKMAEEQIVHLAYHDPLTGLPNRRLLYERLAQAVASLEPGSKGAIVLLDLDNFKTVNDSLGHPMGDELLKSLSRRLQSHARENEVVARIGGDEFVVVIPGCASFEEIDARCRQFGKTFQEPFELGGHTFLVTASIGISLFPDHGLTVEELIKAADLAMYHVKGEGKNAYHTFERQLFQP